MAENLVQERPAETAALSTAALIIAVLAAFDIDVEPEGVAAVVAAVGAIPAIVTAIVNRVRRGV